MLKQQYNASAHVYFKMTSLLPISFGVVFTCLQHASGVIWREWQIYGCFMLFCVPEASLSSGDKQLEGIMASLSVCRVCSLYVSHHSDFDILKSFFFFLFERHNINVYKHSKRVQFGCVGMNFW